MTRRDTTHRGIYFTALLGIPFGPGALPTLRPRMASWTSGVSVKLGSLVGANKYARITSLTTSMTARTDGLFTSWNWASILSARVSVFSASERFPPFGHGRRGNRNSHHVSSYLPRWLVTRNKAFQRGARMVVPPLVLVATDLCGWLTSVFRVEYLATCHWPLQAYIILNASRYRGPWVITLGH